MFFKNRFLQLTLVVLSLAVVLHAEDRENSAGSLPRSCSDATLHGSYGFHATGKDFAAVGRFVFDGSGGLTGKLFARVPGTNIGPLEFTGTYSVSPDCTVTDNWLDSTHVSVIVDQGKGYFILNTSEGPDGVNSGEGRRQ
jgi:hypothetical protein